MVEIVDRLRLALSAVWGKAPLWAYEIRGKATNQVILILTEEQAEHIADAYETIKDMS